MELWCADKLELTESAVVNEWMARGYERAILKDGRRCLLSVLDSCFPGALSEQERAIIETESRAVVLDRWMSAACGATEFEQFRAALNS
jgi:hypothetical protein